MTAAGRLHGLLGEAVCPGCIVPGFGAHARYGEAVRVDPTGQAVIGACVCAVDPSCQGHTTARGVAVGVAPRFAGVTP